MISLINIIIALIILYLCIRGLIIEPADLEIKKETLNLKNWTCQNLKAILISDLHAGAPFINKKKFDKIIKIVNEENPDIIFFTGDLIAFNVLGGKPTDPDIAAKLFSKLKPKYGIYGVLGNHDWKYGGEKVIKALENNGVTVLENSNTKIQLENDDYLNISGLADLKMRYPDIISAIENIDDKYPTIMLSHHPDMFRIMPKHVCLMLSGHTHGGQVNIPALFRIVIPSNFGKRYAVGKVVENEKVLYVSRGIGTSDLPIRLFVKPEITVLTLKNS